MDALEILYTLIFTIFAAGVFLTTREKKILFGNAQHIGNRDEQEDSFGFTDINGSGAVVAVVADGMGGLNNGREASEAAVKVFLDEFAKDKNGSMFDYLKGSAYKANCEVRRLAKKSLYGMIGTTVVAVTIKKGAMQWVSVGDSRLYLYRKKRLIQLTKDHNFGNISQIKGTTLNIEEHERAGELTSFIGGQEIKEMNYNLEPFILKRGDVIMLCSDGVHDVLDISELSEIMGLKAHPNIKAEAVTKASLEKKIAEQDNMTAVVIEVR